MLANRMISLKTLTLPVINWLFGLTRHQKLGLQIAFDVVVAPLSILLAFFLRFETIKAITLTSACCSLVMSIGVHKGSLSFDIFPWMQQHNIGSAMSAAALFENFILSHCFIVPVIFYGAFLLLGMRLFIRAWQKCYKKI